MNSGPQTTKTDRADRERHIILFPAQRFPPLTHNPLLALRRQIEQNQCQSFLRSVETKTVSIEGFTPEACSQNCSCSKPPGSTGFHKFQ